jgi:molecular chaperone GrpE
MSQEPPPNPEDPTPDGASEESLLAQLQADLERFRDLALRSQADFDNFRKRAAREKEDAVKYSNGSFLERLLPIMDNFELGLAAARTETGAGAILSGMEMVARQLQDFLRDCGVEPVEAQPGTPFDPNVHEAVGQQESAEIPEGAVMQQLRRGFKLRERLLRPAMVMVSKGKAAA